MKKIIALIALTASTLSFAAYETVSCDSIRGTNNTLMLIVVNKDVKQLRVTSGLRTRALVPRRLINQNIEGKTLYSVSSVLGLMEVDNKLLEGNGGLVRLANDEFSCF